MNILAIDTSSAACSVALQCGDAVTQRRSLGRSAHGRVLLRLIDELLAEAGLKPQRLDLLACTRGPGAFTGVRIGIAASQGIALAADIPVVPVSSLRVLAQSVASDVGAASIAAAMDARMGEIYWGVFRRHGNLAETLEAERVCAPEVLEPLSPGTWLGVGDGWHTHPEALARALNREVRICSEQLYPEARHVIPLARRAFEHGEIVAAAQLRPVYLRDDVVG